MAKRSKLKYFLHFFFIDLNLIFNFDKYVKSKMSLRIDNRWNRSIEIVFNALGRSWIEAVVEYSLVMVANN